MIEASDEYRNTQIGYAKMQMTLFERVVRGAMREQSDMAAGDGMLEPAAAPGRVGAAPSCQGDVAGGNHHTLRRLDGAPRQDGVTSSIAAAIKAFSRAGRAKFLRSSPIRQRFMATI